jgi:spore maturation protein CgeD
MSESKVSVIVTSYNRPEWLAEAIESVLSQTHSNWEMFVMDDNSPGSDVDTLLGKYQDDRILYFKSNVADEDRSKTCRYATNINLALKLCKGEYISYLTDDDSYYPQRFELMANYLDVNPDVSVVYGYQFCFNDGFPELPVNIRAPQGPLDAASSLVDHNSIMHRKAVLDIVGYWDDSPQYWGHGDAAFWSKLNHAGFKFYPIPEILDRHRFHANSAQSKMQRGVMPYEVG